MSIRLDMPYCWAFKFPEPVPLEKKLKDVLEKEVDEKYYLRDDQVQRMKHTTYERDSYDRRVQNDDFCMALSAREYKDPRCIVVGNLDIKGQDQIKRVYEVGGITDDIHNAGWQSPTQSDDCGKSWSRRERMA